jgi:hypothetical protein
MDKIIRYIKKLEKKGHTGVCVMITRNDVKIVEGYYRKTIDVMTIEEFEEKCGK